MKRINVEQIDFSDDYSYTHNGVRFSGVGYELDASGRLICEITFVNGVQVGPRREWYPSGRKKAEDNIHRGGGLHGLSFEWYESGQLKQKTIAEFGIVLERDEWDEAGNLLESIRLSESDPNYRLLEKERRREENR